MEKEQEKFKMSRSKWKGPVIVNTLLTLKAQKKKKVSFRAGIILPAFTNKTFKVHNGLFFHPLKVTNSIIGYRFGEFVITRKKYIHKKS